MKQKVSIRRRDGVKQRYTIGRAPKPIKPKMIPQKKGTDKITNFGARPPNQSKKPNIWTLEDSPLTREDLAKITSEHAQQIRKKREEILSMESDPTLVSKKGQAGAQHEWTPSFLPKQKIIKNVKSDTEILPEIKVVDLKLQKQQKEYMDIINQIEAGTGSKSLIDISGQSAADKETLHGWLKDKEKKDQKKGNFGASPSLYRADNVDEWGNNTNLSEKDYKALVNKAKKENKPYQIMKLNSDGNWEQRGIVLKPKLYEENNRRKVDGIFEYDPNDDNDFINESKKLKFKRSRK